LKKHYLILLFFILFTAVKSSHSQQYWLTLNSPTNVNLSSCSFADSLRGWVAGDSGKIVHTDDGGQNWTYQYSSVGDENIVSIFFLNERLGWGVSWDITFDTNSYGSNILSTTNGGTNWQHIRYPVEDIFINCVTFVDSLTGYLVGYPGIFVKTTNGGLNWMQVEIDSSFFAGFPPNKIEFYNPQYGFACGGVMDLAGVIWRTTDFGESWSAMGIGPEPLFGIEIFNTQNALCVGGDLEYGPSTSSTTNGGNNWSYNTFGFFGIAFSVSFRTRAEGWAPLGFSQQWMYTIDSGRIWRDFDTPDSSRIYDVQFTDIRNGFAVGDNGVILKYNSTIINVPNKNQNIIPTENILYQNYPNPFNPNSKINFQISKLNHVKLVVYDVLGREIITLINEQLEPGIHEVGFDGTDLSGGLYFYTLIAGDFFETKKMVLIK
jgi:photosystem II stability/assembly factor-like uncharacterized protein